jgi:hypothetical protein
MAAPTGSQRSAGITHWPCAFWLKAGRPAANGSTTTVLNRPAFSAAVGTRRVRGMPS